MSENQPEVAILVTVNARKCMANQQCVLAAPDIFEIGASGYSRVRRDVGPDDIPRLREAEEMCPTASITVEVEEMEPEDTAS
jgi:ferredoxin